MQCFLTGRLYPLLLISLTAKKSYRKYDVYVNKTRGLVPVHDCQK